MLDVDRLLASELVALGDPAACWAALMLWARAWKQTPPASLPDDEAVLAAFSGAGRGWKKVRSIALRGFVKCSDGRLYHRVLAQEANKSWERRRKFQARSAKGNDARWRDQGESKDASSNPSSTAKGSQQGVLNGIHKASLEPPVEGKEKGKEERKKDAASAAPEVPNDEADLFRRGRAVLGKEAGGLISKLLAAKGKNVALTRAAIEQASTKSDPREYVGAIIRGQEKPSNPNDLWDRGL